MPAYPVGYKRKCKMTYLSLDTDAWELLQSLAPTSKAYGRYISELIRRDAIRRAEWAEGRVTVPALAEVGRDE